MRSVQLGPGVAEPEPRKLAPPPYGARGAGRSLLVAARLSCPLLTLEFLRRSVAALSLQPPGAPDGRVSFGRRACASVVRRRLAVRRVYGEGDDQLRPLPLVTGLWRLCTP